MKACPPGTHGRWHQTPGYGDCVLHWLGESFAICRVENPALIADEYLTRIVERDGHVAPADRIRLEMPEQERPLILASLLAHLKAVDDPPKRGDFTAAQVRHHKMRLSCSRCRIPTDITWAGAVIHVYGDNMNAVYRIASYEAPLHAWVAVWPD